MQTLPTRFAAALAIACSAALTTLAPDARAATFTGEQLATIPDASGSFTYNTAGAQLTVLEDAGTTMRGSDLFSFEGLWLGSENTGGGYAFQFNRPVLSISLSFIALTNIGDGVVETLGSFATNAPTTSQFSSADGSAVWTAGVISPVDEDSRGVLGFSSVSATGFTSLRFDHFQPAQLQGVVIDRIDFEIAAIPEPASALLLGAGLLALFSRRRRR